MKTRLLSLLLGVIAAIPVSLMAQENPFWGDGKPFFDIQEIYQGPRVHSVNILVAQDGAILFGGGDNENVLWRSVDGGNTFVADSTYPISTYSSWGFHLDETTGDVLKFDSDFTISRNEPGGSAPKEFIMWRSKDNGTTWEKEITQREKDVNGWYSWAGGCETGITLQYGVHKGRLLRATRVFVEYQSRGDYFGEHYSSALYSDDGGRTWNASAPFPKAGTGEAALVELKDGTIYYNSRDHILRGNRLTYKSRYTAASYDGGKTWQELRKDNYLPDGARDQEHGLMGGLVRLPLDDYDILIYSNIDSPSGRFGSTVWASFDGGKTWPVKRLVDEGGSAYSSLTAGRVGTASEGFIYLLKEGIGDDPHNGIQVARFNLAWITRGRDWKEFITPADRKEW